MMYLQKIFYARLSIVLALAGVMVIISTLSGILSSLLLFQGAMGIFFFGGLFSLILSSHWSWRKRTGFFFLFGTWLLLTLVAIPANSVIYGLSRYDRLVKDLQQLGAAVEMFHHEHRRFPMDLAEALTGSNDVDIHDPRQTFSYRILNEQKKEAFIIEMSDLYGVLMGKWFGPPEKVIAIQYSPDKGIEVKTGS